MSRTKTKPKRVKKEKHRFVCDVSNSLFEEANAARVSFSQTWPDVIEAALAALVERRVK